MTTVAQQTAEQACSILFGSEFTFHDESLSYLHESGIKKAFRSKAKSCHPDLFASPQTGEDGNFLEVKQAYDFLIDLVQNKGGIKVPPQTNRRPSGFSSTRKTTKTYYTGSLPKWKLKLGEYLYYRGHITWNELIEGIVYQRKKRPQLGKLSIEKKVLTPSQRDWVLSICRARKSMPFGTAAVKSGFMNKETLKRLLTLQRTLYPIGRYFLEQNLISPELLAQEVVQHKSHNRSMNSRK